MSFFSRLFKVAQSEANSAVDRLEDPVKMAEQGMRDLKKNLQEALQNLAQVKAVSIRQKKDAEDQKKIAGDYERKAMLLLQKMQAGSLGAAEAENLAGQALQKKDEATLQHASLTAEYETQRQMVEQIQGKVDKLKRDIARYENEVLTLRARARTAESMSKINQQLAGVDSTSTVALLERMKDKVQEQESLAAAYGDLGEDNASLSDQIDSALHEAPASDSLAEMKKRLGIEG